LARGFVVTLNTYEDRKKKIVLLISEVINLISNEFRDKKKSPSHENQELIYIKESLTNILSILQSNNYEEIKTKNISIARIIIDTWPLEDSLGNKICQIEYDFNQLKKHMQ
jgi:hypothetical protein